MLGVLASRGCSLICSWFGGRRFPSSGLRLIASSSSHSELRVSAHKLLDQFNLPVLQSKISEEYGYSAVDSDDPQDYLHYQVRDDDGQAATQQRVKDLYFFSSGEAVFWNLTVKEEETMLKLPQIMGRSPLNIEKFKFGPGSSSGLTAKDRIILTDDIERRTRHQVAFARGMIRGLKVAIIESTASLILERFQDLPKLFPRNSRALSIAGEQQLIEDLFGLRMQVHFLSNLLGGTFEDYWLDPELCELFTSVIKTLETPQRLQVVHSLLNSPIDDLLLVFRDQRFLSEAPDRYEEKLTKLLELQSHGGITILMKACWCERVEVVKRRSEE